MKNRKTILFLSVQSSLPVARADNFYYPPKMDPSQLDQGILIIR
ncbi:hypothetical protein SLEP1_g33681 [Rubroshorea leprosula]|uniref:Uncharacterized protein n=1 Tax=Rubroshorea leprosula TaxID=152421 RepID=A0AAV5KHI2_9ROSI|nr:hypothetical protein SLEP1_g33681 [Rubroshorea leprosula]